MSMIESELDFVCYQPVVKFKKERGETESFRWDASFDRNQHWWVASPIRCTNTIFRVSFVSEYNAIIISSSAHIVSLKSREWFVTDGLFGKHYNASTHTVSHENFKSCLIRQQEKETECKSRKKIDDNRKHSRQIEIQLTGFKQASAILSCFSGCRQFIETWLLNFPIVNEMMPKRQARLLSKFH